jgi:hypothetical protein
MPNATVNGVTSSSVQPATIGDITVTDSKGTVLKGAAAVAAQVVAYGGSATQAEVAAALVSGPESSPGDPIGVLSGGNGPAAGLFQYQPSTWLSNGGGQYAPTAGQATWQQQVAVFTHQTMGNHFGAWGPDLVANSGNPNDPNNPAYGYVGPPQAGSRVANIIEQQAFGDVSKAATGDVGSGPTADAQTLAGDATSGLAKALGFGSINWAIVGSVAIGLLLIAVGLLFFFHKGTRDAVRTVTMAAA